MKPTRKNQSGVCNPPHAGSRALRAWLRLSIVLIAFGVHNVSAQSQWGVVFYTPFGVDAPISDMPWSYVTHVNHLACEPLATGALSFESNFATRATALIAAAHANNRKVLFMVGDFADGNGNFNAAVTNNQSTLITNIISTVNSYGYDGVDIDWESNWDAAKAATFFSALRTALSSKLFTVDASAQNYNDFGSGHNLATYLDRVNVMTYDLTGSWDPDEWFNSPLYRDGAATNWSADYVDKTLWVGAGVPLAKINIALAFYGYTITGGGVTNVPRAVFNPANSPTWQIRNYNDLAASYDLSNPTWDASAMEPWVSISGGWITYDNAQSLAAKINYMKANNMGGWFAWNFESDYISGGNPTHPLLDAVYQALRPAPPTALQATLN